MITRRPTSCFILSLFLLSACAALRDAAPERTVRVRLLADAKLMEKDPRWRETAAGLLHAASDFYGREFGIRFVAAGIAPWELEEASPFVVTLMKRLAQKYPVERRDAGYDMIVALTGERTTFYLGGRGMTNRFGNCREGLGNYIVATVAAPYHYSGVDEPTLDAVALIHEFGHVFGAEHVSDTDSIMNENFDYHSDFDPKSRAAVMKNKFCPFAK
ncbi:MAG TPA: M12 family metallo-peptidase [Candidatus Binatia bacterium]